MTQEVTPSQVEVTQAIDVREERKAFEAWWRMWRGGAEPPATTSHIFDAWLASSRHRARFAEQTRTATEREIREIANSIEVQAGCLERYAESSGFDEKPVPSVFHFQATHFRDLASKLRALSEQKA